MRIKIVAINYKVTFICCYFYASEIIEFVILVSFSVGRNQRINFTEPRDQNGKVLFLNRIAKEFNYSLFWSPKLFVLDKLQRLFSLLLLVFYTFILNFNIRRFNNIFIIKPALELILFGLFSKLRIPNLETKS